MMQSNQLQLMTKVFLDGNDPIIIEDLSGNILALNNEAENCYGWLREELLGKPIKTIVPEGCHPQADELLILCKKGVSVRNIEGLRKNKSGKIFSVLLTLSLLTDNEGGPLAVATFSKDISNLKNLLDEKDFLIRKLEKALDEINTLRGILPICLFCKKIREDSGYWEQVDVYINKYTDADISHGICPECMKNIIHKNLNRLTRKKSEKIEAASNHCIHKTAKNAAALTRYTWVGRW